MIVVNDETTFSKCKLIENKDNSVLKGNNTGVAIAKGEYIFLNPDTVVAEDTFKVLAFAERQKT
jgi:GT2 family glycosyltransferase